MRQRRALGQRLLVHTEVGQPEHLQHPGHNRRTMDPGKPQQVTNKHRQQNCRQRIGCRNQWFENSHNGLRDQHVKMVLNKQAQWIQRQHNHQHRDQQIKRVFDHRRNLIRQPDADVMRLKKTHHLYTEYRHQNRGKDPGAPEAIHRQRAIRLRRGNQQKGHDRQHCAHKGIKLIGFLVVLTEIVGDCGANVDRHDPHRHIKGGQNTSFKLFCQIQPGAGKTPGGIRRERRISKYQQE